MARNFRICKAQQGGILIAHLTTERLRGSSDFPFARARMRSSTLSSCYLRLLGPRHIPVLLHYRGGSCGRLSTGGGGGLPIGSPGNTSCVRGGHALKIGMQRGTHSMLNVLHAVGEPCPKSINISHSLISSPPHSYLPPLGQDGLLTRLPPCAGLVRLLFHCRGYRSLTTIF